MNIKQNPRKPYQLFYLGHRVQHTSLAHMTNKLWCSHFSAKIRTYGEDNYLDHIFCTFYATPEKANLQLCPYYFDQVTNSLHSFHQRRCNSWDSFNLQLRCFDSWASVKEEITRAFLSTTDEKHNEVQFSYRSKPATHHPKVILSNMPYLAELRGRHPS